MLLSNVTCSGLRDHPVEYIAHSLRRLQPPVRGFDWNETQRESRECVLTRKCSQSHRRQQVLALTVRKRICTHAEKLEYFALCKLSQRCRISEQRSR